MTDPAGVPPSIVPTPAATYPTLRGRRVVVGVPGLGWRADLRADNAVVHGSRTYVPVLTEQDFYRAETEQMEVFAPLVPVERVWVEHIVSAAAAAEDGTLDAPPRRIAMPAMVADTLTGRRLVQSVPDGWVRDLRAVTEVYRNTAGVACIRVAGEAEWYAWALSGNVPSTVETLASFLWVE